MAKIPTAANISRASSAGTTNIVRLDNNAAGGLGELSAGLGKMAQRKSDFETSKADLDFLTLKNKQEKDAERDEDYSTMDDRYVSGLQGGLGELALNISDPRARAEFVERHKINIEQGRKRIQDLSFRKETDHERAGIDERLTALREVALTGSPEDVSLAKEAMGNLLGSAQKMGYINEVTAGNVKRTWRDDAALSRLKMMEPEDQLEALKQPWVQDLPSDVTSELRKKAIAASRANKAVVMVDEFTSSGLGQEEAREKLSKIKDSLLRKEVEGRLDYVYLKIQQDDIVQEKGFINTYGMDVSHGDLLIKDIPSEDWDEMTFSTKRLLEGLQVESVNPTKTKTTIKALYYIETLVAQKRWTELHQFLDGNPDVSYEDAKNFQSIGIKGDMAVHVNDGLDDLSRIKTSMSKSGRDPDDFGDEVYIYRSKLADFRRRYEEEYQKKPDSILMQKEMDDLLIKVSRRDDGVFYDSDTGTTLGQINTPEQWKEVVDANKNKDPEAWEEMVSYFEDPYSYKDISKQVFGDDEITKNENSPANKIRVFNAIRSVNEKKAKVKRLRNVAGHVR